ncbi:MAG: methyltransferase protein [Nocardia sp.]|uniref:arsenite methyltransferase n=1 Tax=Nocardia sp. TaxID=1821 RepID=UPI002607D953|nr:arsenite methyltransferase [Nocardia sp.]MCU1647845.1 methyltransferase protein [Nocardia sp.]
MNADRDRMRAAVRARYASAATQFVETAQISDDGGCGPADCGSGAVHFDEAGFGRDFYSAAEQEQIPADAVAASLGCGNPLAVADLSIGDVVLDLGSGAGLDVLLSARRVGPTGKAYGLDMTDEMLALAQANTREAGATNVEFLKGAIEDIPLPAGSVDVVISNCVINLSADKPAVFAQTFRVLRPGGRFGVTDVVAEDHLTPQDRLERGSHIGCIAGALTSAEYRAGLAEAGFTGIEITATHEVAEGMHSAIVKAIKPR